MIQYNSGNLLVYKIAYYCFLIVLLFIPLIPTAHFGNPFHITKNDPLIIIGSLFVILIFYLILNDYKRRKKNAKGIFIDKQIDPYVLLFFLSAAISTIFSVNPFVSYTAYFTRPLGFEVYLYILLLYIFSSYILQDVSKIKMVMFVMELCAVIVCIYAFMQFTGYDPLNLQPSYSVRPLSTLGNGIFLGGFLILIFPVSLMRIIQRRKLSFSIVFPLIILTGIIISQTRTAYVALIVETAVILLLYPIVLTKERNKIYKNLKYSLLIFAGMVIVLILLVVIKSDNLLVKRFVNITQFFQDPRWPLWSESLKVFVKYPITGCGIATFPVVFEDLYTMSFKLHEVRTYFDNAHSNFLHTLCSMGIFGITAYLLLLGHTIYLLVRSIFSETLRSGQKIIYIGFLAMVSGYVIYGIADFDEISIMLYFFIYLSLLKSIIRIDHNSAVFLYPQSLKMSYYKTAVSIFILIFVFSLYNIYTSVKQIIADQYYIEAYALASKSEFKKSLNYFSQAVDLWENNSFYHYQYGGALLSYAVSDPRLGNDAKSFLLENAKSEFLIARDYYPSKRDCMGFVSLIDYEKGDSLEAERIKNELLQKDSLMVNYRLSLAQFFLKKKNYDKAMEHLLFDCRYDPDNVVLARTINSLLNDKECPDPEGYCKRILAVDPKNEEANYFMNVRK